MAVLLGGGRMISLVLALAIGYLIGLMQKGIHIHKEEPKPKEGYNKPMSAMLPPEVQHYYNKTQGQNSWK